MLNIVWVIWRGWGLTIPILYLLCAWIVGFWFPDVKPLEDPILRWSALYTGILLTLQGALIWLMNQPNSETGEALPKTYSSFFYIPVGIWGIGLLTLSIWLFSSDSKSEPSYAENQQEIYQDSTFFDDQATDQVNKQYNLYVDSGYAKLSAGNYAGAIEDYNAALAIDSSNSDLYYNRGFAKYYQKDYEGAKIDYSSAIMLDSTNMGAFFNRALTNYEMGNALEACKDLKQSIAMGKEVTPKVVAQFCN